MAASGDSAYNQSAYAQPLYSAKPNNSVNGFTGIHAQILGFFEQTRDTASGGSLRDLLHRLRGSASEESIRYFYLDFLVSKLSFCAMRGSCIIRLMTIISSRQEVSLGCF